MRLKRLETLLKIKKSEEEIAAKTVSFAQEKLNTEEAKLDQLTTYLVEYNSVDQARLGITNTNNLAAAGRFYAQLDAAKEMQKNSLEQVRLAYEQAVEGWQKIYQAQRAYLKLIEKEQEKENSSNKKREQKENDEIVSGAIARREL